jgi:two-component system, OmpR family, alkaline phosphatase synthesis response regulator PhoP
MSDKSIVVIDDELDMARLLKVELEDQDYHVVLATDGQKGLDLVKQTHPDLVLLDVMMPRIDGFQVLEELKKCESTKNIPVIMLTAKGLEQDIQMGLDLGADDYLVKPFHPALLLKHIQRVLRSGREDDKHGHA